jgi:SAM-dependent MidA family methyltransferase
MGHEPDPDELRFAVAGYRREALPDPETIGEDMALVEAIRAEIAAHGPITFARFMERALYEPGHGYYRRSDAGPGMAAGDFLTAPEAHPIFGAAVGRLAEQAWDAMGRPRPFTVTEPGAGTGALAAGLLGGLRDLQSPLLEAVRYRPVEVEPARLQTLRARLDADGLASFLATDQATAGAAETGVVVANEVLDALPVHRVVGRPGGIRELLVATDAGGAFAWHEGEPSTPALADRLAAEGVALADGHVTEVCLGLDAWLAGTAAHLARGLVVLVDYAAEPVDLHGPGRPAGTLRAFARHAVGADPFRHVGRADLTATVDLAAVRSAAAHAGLAPVGETTQAELLARLGTSDLTDAWLRRPGATIADAIHLRSALGRLMDPRAMGGYRVLAFGRRMPAGLALPALEPVRRGARAPRPTRAVAPGTPPGPGPEATPEGSQ